MLRSEVDPCACPGFPLDFFPVLFAVPRVVGWLAHWREMMLQPGGVKIWRPRQVRMCTPNVIYTPCGPDGALRALALLLVLL